MENVSSEQELKELLEEGKISKEEYNQLRQAMSEKPGNGTKIDCPECGNKISEKAVFCPMCGYSTRSPGAFYCFEHVSKRKLFGWPLVHIVLGPPWDPATGKIRIAKGIIAIGGIAVGGLALGGVSIGIIALGGLALGLAALGGAAIGLLFAAGGLAIGFIAVGGCAIGYYAIGGGAFGIHAHGGNIQYKHLKNLLKK